MKARLAGAALIAMIALAASACSSPASNRTATTDQTLTISVNAAFNGFQPTDLAGTDVQAGAMRQLYDTLVTLSPQRQVQPRLAQSWVFSADKKTLTLTLRSGLKFSDGSPLTASDVVWNISHAQADATAATAQKLFLTIAKATALNPQTVQVSFQQPLAAPFDLFDYLFIAKPQNSIQKLQNSPIGSGPFKLQSWQPSSRAVFVPNPNFWKGQPKLQKIVFQVAGDLQSSKLLFTSKQANFLFDSSWQDYAGFTRDKSVQTLLTGEGGRVEMFLINTRVAPFNDVRVRQAVAAALDRSAIVNAVYKGLTVPWCLPWPTGSIGFQASPELSRNCPADPAKSRTLLAAAGFPNGLSTSLLTEAGTDNQVSQIFQQQLAGVGIKAKLDAVSDDTTFFDRIGSGKWAILTSTVQRLAHDSASSILLGQPLQNDNVSGFKSAAYATLLDQSLHETDPAKRVTIMALINQLLLDQNFFIAITTQTPHYVFSSNLHGLAVTLDGYLILEGASLG